MTISRSNPRNPPHSPWLALQLAIRLAILLVGSGSSASAAFGAEARDDDLLAHSAKGNFWIARITQRDKPDTKTQQPPKERTEIRVRADVAQNWQMEATLPGRIVQLSNRGDALVVLFGNGSWMNVYPDGSSTGTPLPLRASIITFASGPDGLLAIAAVNGGVRKVIASTQPSTLPATLPTTQPTQPTQPLVEAASQPAADEAPRAVLFTMDKGEWRGVADLPSSLGIPARGSISLMTLSDDPLPVLAARGNGTGVIRTFRLTARKTWQNWGDVRLNFEVDEFKLLPSGTDRPLIWVAQRRGPGVIVARGPNGWVEQIPLTVAQDPNPSAVNGVDRDVTILAERIRLVYEKNRQVCEQLYERDGTAVGPPVTLPEPADTTAADEQVQFWTQIGLIAVLALVIWSTMRKRREIEQTLEHRDELDLAPFVPRLGGAMIDMLPLVIASALLRNVTKEPTLLDTVTFWPFWVGFSTYLLHTMIAELISGRSIGKMVFGLKVVGLDGARPRARAIVIRNLLRVIDMVPFMPVIVLYSPLRQRAGDIAAGTLVVRDRAREDQTSEE